MSIGSEDSRTQLMSAPLPVAEWLKSRNLEPFDFQRKCWTAYSRGESGLLNAPTGVGKTLAVWLGPINEWVRSTGFSGGEAKVSTSSVVRQKKQSAPLTVLWITPLRALASDTVNALNLPVQEMGLPWSVELRTGDTSSSIKSRQMVKFPTALVTTPESLSLLLTYSDTRQKMSTLRCVVVDEWHELLGNKRGVQTELAIARLRRWLPALKIWGLSATLRNPESAMATLLGRDDGCLVFGQVLKKLSIETLIPATMDRFPWSGHIGRLGVPAVAEAVANAKTSLVFTNTRNQAELWYQWLTLYEPEWQDCIALHHGSIDRVKREDVERKLAAGELRAVVCTSSLDLGVDFPSVEQVVQVGSPKGIGRLMQRAGRSGHQPGGRSKILCVPTNAFELIEFAAARSAAISGKIEPRIGLVRSLDVLLQHIVTCALGGGFVADDLLSEVRATHAFQDLSDLEWEWALSFLAHGGDALAAYPEYQKVTVHEGVYTVDSPTVARFHRLSVGTITSDSMLTVQYLKGVKLGQIEEGFVARLKPGDRFTFAGKTVEFIRLKEMKAYVRKADGLRGVVPRWLGGRLPLSSQLADSVRQKLNDARDGSFEEPEMVAVKPILDVQRRWSLIPASAELLIERTQTREGHHIFLYPFAGRLVHDGLSALLAYRATRDEPRGVSASATDYGIELLSDSPIPVDDWSRLLTVDHLLDDLLSCLNAAELARRQFREIARVSGLVFSGYPGSHKAARQIQASSGLLYDVFRENDPNNLLVDQAHHEVLQSQLELSRMHHALSSMLTMDVVEIQTERLTPFAFPIWAERMQSTVSTEKYTDRIKKMVVKLEAAAGW